MAAKDTGVMARTATTDVRREFGGDGATAGDRVYGRTRWTVVLCRVVLVLCTGESLLNAVQR